MFNCPKWLFFISIKLCFQASWNSMLSNKKIIARVLFHCVHAVNWSALFWWSLHWALFWRCFGLILMSFTLCQLNGNSTRTEKKSTLFAPCTCLRNTRSALNGRLFSCVEISFAYIVLTRALKNNKAAAFIPHFNAQDASCEKLTREWPRALWYNQAVAVRVDSNDHSFIFSAFPPVFDWDLLRG